MDYKTEFYEILKLAVTDDTALIRVIEKIMKLINNNSIINGKIDEDLKSELIAVTIEEVRKKEFYKKIPKILKNICPWFQNFLHFLYRRIKTSTSKVHWKLNMKFLKYVPIISS